MTLFEVLTGGAFDRLNWQHSGEFDQKFSKKSNARGFARGGMGGFGIDRYIKEMFGNTSTLGILLSNGHFRRKNVSKLKIKGALDRA